MNLKGLAIFAGPFLFVVSKIYKRDGPLLFADGHTIIFENAWKFIVNIEFLV